MLIADCKGRIETIEMRFGFDHGEELQQVKYQMSISHIELVQSLFKGLFSFLQKKMQLPFSSSFAASLVSY